VIAVHEEAIDAKPFPRALLIAGAALIGLSIAFAISARLWDFGATRVEYAPVTEQRELIFKDLDNGSVGVVDAGLKQQIAEVKPGHDGFVRVVMRSMARDRALLGASNDVPFRLARHTDDMLSLTDLATGEVVMLNAFGTMNRRAFEQFLAKGKD
jgi:putative photosynthetic complex assembly protein